MDLGCSGFADEYVSALEPNMQMLFFALRPVWNIHLRALRARRLSAQESVPVRLFSWPPPRFPPEACPTQTQGEHL